MLWFSIIVELCRLTFRISVLAKIVILPYRLFL